MKAYKTAGLYALATLFLILSIVFFSVSGGVPKLATLQNSQLAAVSGAGSGLIGQWTFDEGAGSTAGDSAGTNAGTLIAGMDWLNTAKVGASALKLTGQGGLNVGMLDNSTGENARQLTVSAWVKRGSTDGAGNAILVSKAHNNNASWALSKSSLVNFDVYSPEGGFHVGSAHAPLPGDEEWHLITGVYDGSPGEGKLTVYVDGRPGTQVSMTGYINPYGVPTCIGANSDGGCMASPFTGGIDDVRIYNRALTIDEIEELCSLGTGGCPGAPSTGGDQERPSVSITAPSEGASIQSSVTLAANASDNVGVKSVQFKVDGVNIGSPDTAAPYSASFNSRTVSNGTHAITATAIDAAGNVRTSASVNVAVSNESDTVAPVISNISSSASLTSATITWDTSGEDSDTQVEYGLISTLGSFSPLSSVYTKTHSVKLSKLLPNTAYQFKVMSRDEAGNLSVSEVLSLKTLARTVVTETIDNSDGDTLFELPSSALNSGVINFMPGQNETVAINPPVFSWLYNMNNPTGDPGNYSVNEAPVHEFQFQIAYSRQALEAARLLPDPRQALNLAANVRTESNLYNFLAPLNEGEVYWQVGYAYPGEATPFSWSTIRKFRIPSGTPKWNRSMLAGDELVQSGRSPSIMNERGAVHPRLIFTEENREAFYNDILTKKETDSAAESIYKSYKNTADAAIASAWWRDGDVNYKNPGTGGATTYVQGKASDIMAVAFMWQMTRDPKYLDNLTPKPQELLVKVSESYISSGAFLEDIAAGGSGIGRTGIVQIALAFDFLHQKMSADQLKRVADVIGKSSKNAVMSRLYRTAVRKQDDPINDVYSTDRSQGVATALGESHTASSLAEFLFAALAAYSETTSNDSTGVPFSFWTRKLADLTLNNIIGKPMWNGSGENVEGGGYASTYTAVAIRQNVLANLVFPEAKFNKNPFFANVTDWWDRFDAVDNDPSFWGKGGYQKGESWNYFGYPLALFAQDPTALKHWRSQMDTSKAFNGQTSNVFGFENQSGGLVYLGLIHNFSLPTSPAPQKPLAKVFRQGGWAMGASGPTSEAATYKDGVGFMFAAKPGSRYPVNLSFDIFAYGQTITENGAGGWSFNGRGISHNTILLGGIGQWGTGTYSSRIFAYKYKPGVYTYVAGEGSNMYRYPGTPKALKVNRHFLMVKDKYFIVFDDLKTATPTIFTSLYHLPQGYAQFTSPYSFNYTKSKLSLPTNPGYSIEGQPVKVFVSQIAHTKDGALKRLDDVSVDRKGINRLINPINPGGDMTYDYSEAERNDYSAKCLPETNPSHNACPDFRTESFWVSNSSPVNEFNFMTVIFPQKLGVNPPVITPINDFTARVEWDNGSGTTTDVISFDADSAPTDATLIVDLEDLQPIPVADDAVPVDPPVITNRTLSILKSGTGQGTVSSSLGSINCGTTCSYTSNATVSATLTATPAPGSIFLGWAGGDCSGTGSCTVSLSRNMTVTATFNLSTAANHTLTVSKSGTGSGSVTGSGINCDANNTDCSETKPSDSVIALTATPAIGSTFGGWQGACSGTGSCSVNLSSDRIVTALFTFSGNGEDDNGVAPVISDIAESVISSRSATISWTTDKIATSQIEYGKTTAYGSVTTPDLTFSESHSQSLASLVPNTTYHYRIVSRDVGGTSAVSADRTFVTPKYGEGDKIVTTRAISAKSQNYSRDGLVTTVLPIGSMGTVVSSQKVTLGRNSSGWLIAFSKDSQDECNPNWKNDSDQICDGLLDWRRYSSETLDLVGTAPVVDETYFAPYLPPVIIDAGSTGTVSPGSRTNTGSIGGSSSGGGGSSATPTASAKPAVVSQAKPLVIPAVVATPAVTTSSTAVTKQLLKGSTGSEVVALQTALEKEKLLKGTYTKGTFDTPTEVALKSFQQKYFIVISGTPATTGFGATGPKTRTKLNEILSKIGAPAQAAVTQVTTSTAAAKKPQVTKALSLGSRDAEVVTLQAILVKEKLLTTYTKGVFDAATETALKAFQKKYGIVSSGTVSTTGYGSTGPKTRARLNLI